MSNTSGLIIVKDALCYQVRQGCYRIVSFRKFAAKAPQCRPGVYWFWMPGVEGDQGQSFQPQRSKVAEQVGAVPLALVSDWLCVLNFAFFF